MNRLYINIKSRRTELGMSQEELAKKTGYTSRSSIAKIEKGEVDLTQTKINLFAKALGTTPAELMGWEEIQKNNDILSDIIIRAQRNDKFFEVMKSLYSIADNRLDMAKAVIDALNQ